MALNIYKDVFGDDHPDVALSLNNLGGDCCNYDPQLSYYRTQLELITFLVAGCKLFRNTSEMSESEYHLAVR